MEFAFLDLTPRLAIVEHGVNQVAEHFRQMGDFAVGGGRVPGHRVREWPNRQVRARSLAGRGYLVRMELSC